MVYTSIFVKSVGDLSWNLEPTSLFHPHFTPTMLQLSCSGCLEKNPSHFQGKHVDDDDNEFLKKFASVASCTLQSSLSYPNICMWLNLLPLVVTRRNEFYHQKWLFLSTFADLCHPEVIIKAGSWKEFALHKCSLLQIGFGIWDSDIINSSWKYWKGNL